MRPEDIVMVTMDEPSPRRLQSQQQQSAASSHQQSSHQQSAASSHQQSSHQQSAASHQQSAASRQQSNQRKRLVVAPSTQIMRNNYTTNELPEDHPGSGTELDDDIPEDNERPDNDEPVIKKQCRSNTASEGSAEEDRDDPNDADANDMVYAAALNRADRIQIDNDQVYPSNATVVVSYSTYLKMYTSKSRGAEAKKIYGIDAAGLRIMAAGTDNQIVFEAAVVLLHETFKVCTSPRKLSIRSENALSADDEKLTALQKFLIKLRCARKMFGSATSTPLRFAVFMFLTNAVYNAINQHIILSILYDKNALPTVNDIVSVFEASIRTMGKKRASTASLDLKQIANLQPMDELLKRHLEDRVQLQHRMISNKQKQPVSLLNELDVDEEHPLLNTVIKADTSVDNEYVVAAAKAAAKSMPCLYYTRAWVINGLVNLSVLLIPSWPTGKSHTVKLKESLSAATRGMLSLTIPIASNYSHLADYLDRPGYMTLVSDRLSSATYFTTFPFHLVAYAPLVERFLALYPKTSHVARLEAIHQQAKVEPFKILTVIMNRLQEVNSTECVEQPIIDLNAKYDVFFSLVPHSNTLVTMNRGTQRVTKHVGCIYDVLNLPHLNWAERLATIKDEVTVSLLTLTGAGIYAHRDSIPENKAIEYSVCRRDTNLHFFINLKRNAKPERADI